MAPHWIQIVSALIGIGLVGWFVIGLSYSISIGFAGIIGGLPFAIIVIFVLLLMLYDFWDQCLRKNKADEN